MENSAYGEAQFSIYYEKNIRPLQEENDKKRRKYIVMFCLLALLAAIFYPYLLWRIINNIFNNQQNNFWIGIALALSGFAIMLLSAPVYFYKKTAKSGGIMQKFAEFFGSFSYLFEKSLSPEVLNNSFLFKKFDSVIGGDCFVGKYKDVGITIAETKTMEENYDAKAKKYKKRKLFQGVCILLDMNKNFLGQTIVLKDKGFLNVLNKHGKLHKVALESVEFEKKFEVYSDNQIEARYLLTTAFMERILKLNELYAGKSIELSFMNNKLMLAICTEENLFEACSFFKSNVNKKQAMIIYRQFCTIFSIIEILKLHQKTGL